MIWEFAHSDSCSETGSFKSWPQWGKRWDGRKILLFSGFEQLAPEFVNKVWNWFYALLPSWRHPAIIMLPHLSWGDPAASPIFPTIKSCQMNRSVALVFWTALKTCQEASRISSKEICLIFLGNMENKRLQKHFVQKRFFERQWSTKHSNTILKTFKVCAEGKAEMVFFFILIYQAGLVTR